MHGGKRLQLLMQFTEDQEQILALLWLWIRWQESFSSVDLFFIEVNVDEREAHRQHEEWRREQKYGERRQKRAIEIGPLDRYVLKQRITQWKN
jgi:hypothetical protein